MKKSTTCWRHFSHSLHWLSTPASQTLCLHLLPSMTGLEASRKRRQSGNLVCSTWDRSHLNPLRASSLVRYERETRRLQGVQTRCLYRLLLLVEVADVMTCERSEGQLYGTRANSYPSRARGDSCPDSKISTVNLIIRTAMATLELQLQPAAGYLYKPLRVKNSCQY